MVDGYGLCYKFIVRPSVVGIDLVLFPLFARRTSKNRAARADTAHLVAHQGHTHHCSFSWARIHNNIPLLLESIGLTKLLNQVGVEVARQYGCGTRFCFVRGKNIIGGAVGGDTAAVKWREGCLPTIRWNQKFKAFFALCLGELPTNTRTAG